MRRGLTYSNVVATLALFLALGGGAVWAAGGLGGSKASSSVVTTSIRLALNEQAHSDVERIVHGGGSVVKVSCEQGLPQLIYDQGDLAKSFLSIAIYRNGVVPLIHKATSGVDPLPHNGDPAEIDITLRLAGGKVKQAHLSYDYRPGALGTNHTCFYQGTLTRSG